MIKRQRKGKQYRKVHPNLEIQNWCYVNDFDTSSGFAKNLNRIIEEHRRIATRVQHNVPRGTSLQ